MIATGAGPLHALSVLWRVLSRAERRRFVRLQLLSVLMALSTLAGLAAVVIFLAALADPAVLQTHVALRAMVSLLPAATPAAALQWLGAAFICLLGLSALVNVLGSLAGGRFAYAVADRIRETLFGGYLGRDYLFHLRTGAAALTDHVLYQCDRVTITLVNGQLLIAHAALTLFVVVSIAIVKLSVALTGLALIGGFYLLMYGLVRKRVSRNGRALTHLGVERVAVVERAFHGIKYLLVAHAQGAFAARFSGVTRAMSRTAADTQFIGQFPRYLLEFVAGGALIACAGLAVGGTAATVWLAQVSFVAFAGFRLLPAIQQMYGAYVAVRANLSALQRLEAELDGLRSPQRVEPAVPPRPLRRHIDLIDVGFRYAPGRPAVLERAVLRIEAGTAVGIVGSSGCGKTTLLDLVLGLLSPVSGRIEIDGEVLTSDRARAWQRNIGYVPQDVMILDATVRENVAFEAATSPIDDARVRDVLRQAGALEFVEALPGGIEARLGGNDTGGLSAGQRQRLGIARALYGNPSVLIFDEGTNSLDASTEHAIVDELIRRRGQRTVLLVAHGGAALAACDRVLELRQGRLREIPRAAGTRALG